MITLRCPKCDTSLEAPQSLAGQTVVCAECGAGILVPVPASAQIIEVHAEPVDEAAEAELYEGDPFFNPSEQKPLGADRVWGRNVHVQHVGNGGSGCCAGGCLLIGLVIFFTIYGVVSFFR